MGLVGGVLTINNTNLELKLVGSRVVMEKSEIQGKYINGPEPFHSPNYTVIQF